MSAQKKGSNSMHPVKKMKSEKLFEIIVLSWDKEPYSRNFFGVYPDMPYLGRSDLVIVWIL